MRMGYAMKNVNYVIIALLSIILALSISILHYKKTSVLLKSQRDSSNKFLKIANDTIKNFNKRQQALFLLDKSHTEALNVAESENETLRRQLVAGTSRMYIRGKCVSSSFRNHHTSTGMDYGTSVELSRNAGQHILYLRAAIIRDNEKLSFLQNYVSEECHN